MELTTTGDLKWGKEVLNLFKKQQKHSDTDCECVLHSAGDRAVKEWLCNVSLWLPEDRANWGQLG